MFCLTYDLFSRFVNGIIFIIMWLINPVACFSRYLQSFSLNPKLYHNRVFCGTDEQLVNLCVFILLIDDFSRSI